MGSDVEIASQIEPVDENDSFSPAAHVDKRVARWHSLRNHEGGLDKDGRLERPIVRSPSGQTENLWLVIIRTKIKSYFLHLEVCKTKCEFLQNWTSFCELEILKVLQISEFSKGGNMKIIVFPSFYCKYR